MQFFFTRDIVYQFEKKNLKVIKEIIYILITTIILTRLKNFLLINCISELKKM